VTSIRRYVVAAALFLCFASAGAVQAQRPQPNVEELTKKRDDKLKLEFLKKASWTTDWEAALADAKKNDRLIFAYFTRSYAK
jgi:hypothetical protein